MIRKLHSFIIAAFAALGLVGAPSLAGDLVVVHGITGSDLGLPNQLPVDIGLDDVCTGLQDVEFGQSAPAGTLDAGIYEAQVFLADGAPCGGTLAVAADIEIPVVGTVFAIAHLDQNGLPKLSQFTANLGDVGGGLAKVQVAHTAAAPAVDVQLKARGVRAGLNDIRPGDQSFAAQVPTVPFNVQIKPAAGGRSLLTLDSVSFGGDAYTIVFAVGSLEGGTFTVLPVEVVP